MASTFGRIETLMRGLQAQQRAIDANNHNIANANTPGYARQRVDLVTTPPYTVPTFSRDLAAGQMGTGVAVASVSRLRDTFLDTQYRAQAQRLGDAETRSTVYGQVEVVFNEPNDSGLNVFLDRFWQSWQSLVNKPDDPATRSFVVESASNLAANLNRARQQIETQTQSAADNAGLQVREINAIARDLADLNAQITAVTGVGQQPNDLMDARDNLLDRLAKLIGTNNVVGPDGAINVFIGGRALVDRNQANALDTATTAGTLAVTWASDGAVAAASGGSTMALVDLHNTALPAALTDLATMRDAIVNQVNTQHRAGYGLNDPAGPPPNRDFFEVLANGDVRVRDEIATDPSKIAAAVAAGKPGDGGNALVIANARYARTLSGGTATIGDFYNAMVASIGGKARQAAGDETNQSALVDTVDRQRRQVSEVSLDEEAANMIKYQQAYAAAARAMTTVDEMLNTIINGMGLVGR